MYDPPSRSELQERGDYEAWLIRECLNVLQKEQGVVAPLSIEIGDEGRTTAAYRVVDHVGAQYAAEVVHNLLPLMFTAAFKIIDMVIEWCLIENGASPKGKFFSFAEKIRQAQSGKVAVWPDLLNTDADLQRVLAQTYTTIRPKRNAIVHGVWGAVEDGKLVFDYVYEDDLASGKPKKHDKDEVTENIILVFCEFAAFLFGRLTDPSRWESNDLVTLRRLSNAFRIMHGVAPFIVPDRQFFQLIRVTDRDTVNMDEILDTIRKISPTAKDVSFELEIRRKSDKWLIPQQHTSLLNGEVLLSDLSRFKKTT